MTGLYTVGFNETGSEATDTITVIDQANDYITASTEVKICAEKIQGSIIGLFPDTFCSSNLLTIYGLLIIFGDNTLFNNTSTILFDPGNKISSLFSFGFGDILFALIALEVGNQEEWIDLFVTTETEEDRFHVLGKDLFHIVPLSFNLDEDFLFPIN